MKKLDWYIIKRFVGTFFYAIIILAVISCVIDYTQKVDDFVNSKAPFSKILGYYKNFVPYISAMLYPLFVFIACIFFTSKLAYKSEIIAMLATGVSFNRMLRPYMIASIFLGGMALLVNHFVVPMANKQRIAFEKIYVKEHRSWADRNVHLQLSNNLLIYVQSYDYDANYGTYFTAEKIDGIILKEKLKAESTSYDSVKKTWLLRNVKITTFDSLKETVKLFSELNMKYPFVPKDLQQDDAVKEALTTPELNKYIEKQRLHGNQNLNFYFTEKHRRTSTPFSGFILSIIGVCIASRKIRGGSGLHLAIGIALCAVYMMALQLSTTFSTKAGLDPGLALWIPNFIFAALALYLYRRQIK